MCKTGLTLVDKKRLNYVYLKRCNTRRFDQ